MTSHHYPIPSSTEAVPLHKYFRYFAPMAGRDSFLDHAMDENCKGLEFATDSWAAAVLAVQARGVIYWDLMSSAKDIIFNKLIKPSEFMLESVVFPEPSAIERFHHNQARYWGRLLLNHAAIRPGMHQEDQIVLDFLNPRTLLDSFGPERYIKVVVLQPLAYQAHGSSPHGPKPLGLERVEHRDQWMTGSAAFFASRVYHLRIFSKSLKDYHIEDDPRHERALHDLYNVLLSMLLYFLAFADRVDVVNGELGATPEEWRAVRAAVDAVMVDGKFGTDTYELNCHFLTRNKVKLEEWFESAAHWWCPSVPEDRQVLLHAAKAMEEVLYWLFGLAAKPSPFTNRSLSYRSTRPASNPFSPLARSI